MLHSLLMRNGSSRQARRLSGEVEPRTGCIINFHLDQIYFLPLLNYLDTHIE